MPIYQFVQGSFLYYRVHAKTEEDALDMLEKAQLSDEEAGLELYYDRTETCMDFEFDSEWPDSSRIRTTEGIYK